LNQSPDERPDLSPLRPGDKILGEGLTFDDVLLVPGRSRVHPKDVDVRTRLAGEITLNIPIVSAAMDTVTESELAIALAREGGIGVIHKNLSIQRQGEEVDKVKRSESGMIVNPITLTQDAPLAKALDLMQKFRISGVPITRPDGVLVGILTNRDLRFVELSNDLKVSDVMTKERLITVPVGTSLEDAKALLHKHRVEKLPVVDDHNVLKGLITVKDIQKKLKYPNAAKDSHGRLRVAAAIGVSEDALERVAHLAEQHVDAVVLDSAHGHSEGVIRLAERVKSQYPDLPLIVGNIATREAARDLVSVGVDAIKVGMGPGASCTTRVVAGIGVPQITAILECASVAVPAGVPLIADGGIRYSGDIVKALAAGASTVMIGQLFAGTEESPGESLLLEGRSYKVFRGMGSLSALHEGSADRYFQDAVTDKRKLVSEGIEGRVPYKGPLTHLVYQLVGGLRAGMGYVGVARLDDLVKQGRFIRISASGLRESHPHDVTITKEPPNYEPR
jgi:IMP dehydrogenase